MKTVKTLILAVRILLSLGIGTAMAQSESASASMPTNFYGVVKVPTWSHQATTHRILAGSVDADSTRSGAHVFPFAGQYGNVANPG